MMHPDEQEAKSRRYSNDIIHLLKLSSGNYAVFNRGGDYCGTAVSVEAAVALWRAPARNPRSELNHDLLEAAGL